MWPMRGWSGLLCFSVFAIACLGIVLASYVPRRGRGQAGVVEGLAKGGLRVAFRQHDVRQGVDDWPRLWASPQWGCVFGNWLVYQRMLVLAHGAPAHVVRCQVLCLQCWAM